MKLPRFRISYYDERSPDVVVIGGWEMVLCDRKFGKGTIADPSLEAVFYQAYLGARRAGVLPSGIKFDDWVPTVAMVEPVEDPSSDEDEDEDGQGESPAPPAT